MFLRIPSILKDSNDSHNFGDDEDKDPAEEDPATDDGPPGIAVEAEEGVAVCVTWLSFMCSSS